MILAEISVIVPVLDDDEKLEVLLGALVGQVAEIIVVDGGSSKTVEQLCSGLGASYIGSIASRGDQVARGIENSRGSLIWVLHVDAFHLAGPLSRLTEFSGSPEAVWGRFDVMMPKLYWIPKMMNLRSRLTKICTGDQGMFFMASLLNEIGGFPSQPLMEDIEMSRRLKQCEKARFVACQEVLGASDRRWRSHGILKTVFKMWWYRLLYFLGKDPGSLYRSYYGKSNR